ncbi:MAG: arginine--tRNA ligase [Candidatus Pacebacteria bacterium]|nr:arginine--tRNA ligase [Candidatus Paceibacterota bacterium]
MEIKDFFQENTTVDFAEKHLRGLVAEAIKKLGIASALDFMLEHPAEETRGDYAANVAMVLARQLKKNPLEIANAIADKVSSPTLIEKIEVRAPGFINFHLKQAYYKKELAEILAQKEKYGSFELNEPKKIMVEFGQPNTHKAFHIGHLRSALSGLALAKLFKNSGYAVIKTNYYGDIGMQTSKTTWGMAQKALPEDFDNWDKHKRMKYIDDAYVLASEKFADKKIEIEIRKINRDIYNQKDTAATRLHQKIKKWSLEHLSAVFADLGIVYDKQYPESEVSEKAIKIVEENIGGIFEKSEGAIIYNGEKDGLATWVFRTSEGNPTYSAKDLALAFQKFEDYDLDLNITLTSVEQTDYFKAVIKILETLDGKFKGKYLHIPFGWVLRAGKKTASRMGGSVKGTDILQEAYKIAKTKIKELKDYNKDEKGEISKKVALAGLKFLILSHEFHKNINYNPQKFINFEGFSGPFILYSYVRARSILQKSHTKNLEAKLPSLSSGLKSEYELKLLKWLARYPQIARRACVEVSPHLVCNYLYELSQRFNQFYATCPVLTASETDKNARLALTAGAAQVLKNALGLLGIETVEKM